MQKEFHKRSLPAHAATALLLVAVTGLFSACSLLTGPTPPQPERHDPVTVRQATYIQGGSAQDNEPIFVQTLQKAAALEGDISSSRLAEQFIEAGFEAEKLQVSHDTTRTDLEPESMFVGAHILDECLVGQIILSDRSVTAQIMPSVGPDAKLCLIGEMEEITP